MKVVRKAVTRYVETYELELTDDYIAYLNNHLQECCTEELPLLTAEDIVNIVNYEDNFQKQYIWNCQMFSQNLGDYVRDLINDDIWDLPYESDFIETESFETQAFRTEEERRNWKLELVRRSWYEY